MKWLPIQPLSNSLSLLPRKRVVFANKEPLGDIMEVLATRNMRAILLQCAISKFFADETSVSYYHIDRHAVTVQ